MRERLQPLFPDLFFARVSIDDLAAMRATGLPFPLIIKPAVGFFSLAVVSARSPEEWDAARARLIAEVETARGLFPTSVLDPCQMLIEQRVEGRGFAVDVYFDSDGTPVLLNVMEHIFRGPEARTTASTSPRPHSSVSTVNGSWTHSRRWLASWRSSIWPPTWSSG